jgi:hypothetical protein
MKDETNLRVVPEFSCGILARSSVRNGIAPDPEPLLNGSLLHYNAVQQGH